MFLSTAAAQDLQQLRQQFDAHYQAGRYQEAEQLSRQILVFAVVQ